MPELLHSLHSGDASRQVWAEQPGISRLVGESPHSGKLLINCVGSKTLPFQEDAVANDNDAIES
jgi:hypothetical protein